MEKSFTLPVSLRIRGSREKVFSAWTTKSIAEKWLCDRMEGEWAPGNVVFWHHGEHRQEIRVTRIEPGLLLAFRWNAYGREAETEVEIQFRELGPEIGVLVQEASWPLAAESVKLALDHACGWENTLCRLKAWIEAKVRLGAGPRPVTPMVGCDAFVLNEENKVLLIQRADNKCWALPGGHHDLGETPKQCAERECREETGYQVKATALLGAFSSNCYEYINYPHKENEYCHLLFAAELSGGEATASRETLKVGWFGEKELPELSDGHEPRIKFGFSHARGETPCAYFE